MYVVTFYSFKGGVGRSMALVNAGVQLAQAGKKVLLVDFDLEAPGLPTFDLDKPAEDAKGVVDFVTHYIDSGEAPSVSDYVYKSRQFTGGGGLWVMPVGTQDGNYSHRLNSINWRQLYEEQQGYLLLEDLKAQWKATLAPDYVLIDSRTGHSDVEGVCTRQLPDAVCLFFFPNEQNLQGLKRVVRNIQEENEGRSRSPIVLHFVVSNVPDLDDEERILRRTLTRFRQELGYKRPAAEIHHYNSLSLLNQEIFSLDRPNSRLTREYRQLVKAITKENLEDRDAVIDLLKTSRRSIGDVMEMENVQKLESILKNFPDDGEVVFRVALLYERIGNNLDALNLLSSDVVDRSYPTASMYATRARLQHRLGKKDGARRNLEEMLDAENADIESFLEATSLIDQLNPALWGHLPSSRALMSLRSGDRMFAALQYDGSEEQLKAAAKILMQVRQERPEEPDPLPDALDEQGYEIVDFQLSLILIALGDIDGAISLLEPPDRKVEDLEIASLYNLASARWARDNEPPIRLFELVLEKAARKTPSGQRMDSPNFAQCMTIASALVKKPQEGQEWLKRARISAESEPGRIFSAWSYSKVSQKEFLTHLSEIEGLLKGDLVVPRFVSKASEHQR